MMSTHAPRKQINLYQAEFRPVQVALPTQSLLLGIAVFGVGLLLVHALDTWRFAQYRSEVDAASQRADKAEQRLAQAAQSISPADPAVVTEATTLEARANALQQAQAAINSGALGSETGYSAQFAALTRATVPGAWLTQIELADRGHVMNLTGRATQGEAPANLIAALRRQPLFTGLTYAALQVQPPAADDKDDGNTSPRAPTHLEFSLSAQLPEAPSTQAAPPPQPPVGATR